MTAIEEYIEKYCEKHNCSKEEAEKHEVVQMMKRHYEDTENKK